MVIKSTYQHILRWVGWIARFHINWNHIVAGIVLSVAIGPTTPPTQRARSQQWDGCRTRKRHTHTQNSTIISVYSPEIYSQIKKINIKQFYYFLNKYCMGPKATHSHRIHMISWTTCQNTHTHIYSLLSSCDTGPFNVKYDRKQEELTDRPNRQALVRIIHILSIDQKTNAP